MATEGYTKFFAEGYACKYKKFFEDADTDGDGYLTLEELTAILWKKGYKTSDSEILTMFNAVDVTGDSKISLEEYLFAMGKRPQTEHKDAVVRASLRSFDKNGDGKIDSAELDQVFREMGRVLPDIDQIIQLADLNKEYEELIAQVFGK